MEEYMNNQQMQQQYEEYQQPANKETLPNAVASLVLGILSIVLGCNPVGIILGPIGMSKAKKAFAIDQQYPGYYTGQGMAKAGKTTSVIGLILGIVGTIFWIAYILFFVWLAEEGYDLDQYAY
ncbi:MAG: DUF4190 domain-containing protein [Bacteroidales bacterium]|nr:DUF4190 domain-containing protein [Bacteroidales bacterium]MBR5028101.1 DUF4190 domain-containing protein [Bacteroidales bacterium]